MTERIDYYERICTTVVAFEVTVYSDEDTCVDKIADAMAEYARRLKEDELPNPLDQLSVDTVMANGVKARALTANNIALYKSDNRLKRIRIDGVWVDVPKEQAA